jgi:quercetin 2,3-dioxygenase
MIQIRKSEERGRANHGWLDSKHSFSFAEYYDPQHMGFRSLRVINEDRIVGGSGFATHPHRDMEIISYVITGALEHKDSMGNSTVIRPGEVQRMSAGTGVRHSEFNHFADRETHFFQIWILPNRAGLSPGYGQKSFEKDLAEKNLVLVVSEDGRDGSIEINQDADLYISRLNKGESLNFNLRPQRHTWIQVVKGEITVNSKILKAGDGLSATAEATTLALVAQENSELLLFDLN